MPISENIPAGPALRLHLIELLLPTAGRDVVDLARQAETFVLGSVFHTRSESLADAIIRRSRSAASLGPVIGHGDDLAADLDEDRQWAAIIMPGDDPIEAADHDRPVQTSVAIPDAVSGTHGDCGNGESDEQPPAQGGTAQDLTSSSPPSRKVPQGHVQWTPARKAELKNLCEIGLEAREIEERMGLKDGSAFANAYRFGWIDLWRESRECRRAGKPMPERDVPPGSSWAFTENKPLSEVMDTEVKPEQPLVEIRTVADDATAMALEADRPVPPPLPVSDEIRLIEEHIKAKGVTTAEPDYGPDQPAVDALRRSYNDVVRSNDPKSPWLVNGMRCSTSLLWKRANADLKARREKTIKRSA